MDKTANKSNDSYISTTGTPHSPHYSDNMDNNVKYINLNFVDNSESSSHAKDALLEYQKLHNSFEKTKSTKPPPSKILPSTIPGMEKTKNKDEPLLKEKTLVEMGFKATEVEGWENIVQPPKENLYKLLKNMINGHIKPNVQIRVGGVTFNCHMFVLQCYSDFFMECNNEVYIQLPEEKITPGAFMMVYDWMLAEEPLVQREGILELFNAANFLRIKELINQCWLCLDDDVRFREDTAFLLYLEARNYGLESLEQLMLMRICKFFLTLVASKEFLSLNAKEICTLLSSNTIGVNSEIEIFMSVVRWLSHNWEERESHMLDIVKCVRFSLMPPWFLVTLTKNTDCIEIDRVVNHSEVKKMINDGISYTTTQLYYGENREEFLHFLERYQLVSPMQRQWVFDKECSYHHRLECPNMQYVTYKSFLEYLEMIQTIGKDYWRSLEMAKGIEKLMQCCMRSDCRKSVDPNLGTISTKKSRDQGIQCESFSTDRRERRDYSNSKTNLTHNIGSKTSMRRTPRGHPKYVPSTAMMYSINNDNTTTETETTVDFKYPKESCNVNHRRERLQQSQQQQPENTLFDNNNQQQKMEVKEQQKQTILSINNIDNNEPKKQQPQQQEQEHKLSKSLRIKKQQQHRRLLQSSTKTSTASCKVIYKRDDGLMTDVSSDDTIGGHHHHHPQPQQPQEQPYIIENNTDVELERNNISEVINKTGGCNDNEDLLECRTTKHDVVDMKSIPNRKILVFGGIDPYCLHCQHVQQHQMYLQQQQQQQQQHLQQQQHHQQRKRVHSIDTILNTHHILRSHQNDTHAHTIDTNTLANNKFENFGDHVLLYDDDVMEWQRLSHIPFGSRHHHAVVVCNGLVYVIGGTRTAMGCTQKSVFEKSVWCFDPHSLKWTLEGNLPESRRDFAVISIDSAKCGECNGSKDKQQRLKHDIGFYVIGGEGVNGMPLNTVWFYNVKTRVWLKKPSLNIGRYGLAAAMVNNEIWVAGGIINDNTVGICGYTNGETTKATTAHVITDTMEIYNLKCTHEILANNDMKGLPNVTTHGDGVGDGVGGGGDNVGSILLSKGADDGDVSNESRENAADGALAEDCACNVGQWIISRLHLRVPRLFGKFGKMSNGHLYLVGGIGLSDKGDLTSLTDIDKYNLEQNKWEHNGDLNWARHGHDVGIPNDHSLVVIGGVSTLKKCTLNTVEVFCTNTRKCLKYLPDLPWPVSGCAVVTLN